MSGILNKKTSFIDLVVTEEGRRQLAQGGFRPTFASFSDKCVNYSSLKESTKGAIENIYLQTPPSLKDDKIVYETDDSGKLIVAEASEEFTIVGDDLFKKDATGTEVKYLSVTGEQFSSTVDLVKDEVIKSFQRNKFTRSISGFEADGKKFKTTISDHTFVISNSVPFPKGPDTAHVDIDNAETFMFDSKLAHHKNFLYLPPLNEDGSSYGSYQDFRSLKKQTFKDIKNSLNIGVMPSTDRIFDDNTVLNYVGDLVVQNRAPNLPFNSTLIAREHAQIQFLETSEENNIIAQFYEESSQSGLIKKLDVIDAGEFSDEEDPDRPGKHVFYVGKIFFDSNKIPTFVNMFTMIMD